MQTREQNFDLESEAGRQQAAVALFPYIRAVANRVHEHLPPWIDRDDLVQAGVLGLYSAMRNYDPKRNPRLPLYAAFRIRGAMLDFLREQDCVSRQTRQQLRKSGEPGPTWDGAVEKLEAAADLDPHRLAAQAETRERILQALHSLRPKHRRVIELYYFAELTMREVATHLHVNESRVSQIHSKAIQKLRGVMAQPIPAR